ncbi:glycosyltransferase [bacterium]|nr:glycosyltransferase [bacterium]
MKVRPLASIVMVNRNNGRFIGEAIESAVRQTYSRWEMIIVENASTDGSWEIIQCWANREPRIQAIRFSHRVGIPAGRNLALARTKGEYIATLDSDDVWLPERLTQQIEFMEHDENKAVGICGANCFLIDGEGMEIGRKEFPGSDAECRRAFWYRNPFCHSASLVRKSCFDKLGIYDESFELAEDLELWMRLGQFFRFYNTSEYLARFRLSGRNVTLLQHREMIRQTLRARRMAITRYGYTTDFAGRIAFAFTCCMQWLPPSLVHRLFYGLLLRRLVWIWEAGKLQRRNALKEGRFASKEERTAPIGIILHPFEEGEHEIRGNNSIKVE